MQEPQTSQQHDDQVAEALVDFIRALTQQHTVAGVLELLADYCLEMLPVDGVGVLPYAAVDAIHADPIDPLPFHERAALLADLPPEAVDALVAAAGDGSGSPLIMVEIRQLGGALARGPRVPNAVAGRGAAWTVYVVGVGVPELAGVVPMLGRGVLDAYPRLAEVGELRVVRVGDEDPVGRVQRLPGRPGQQAGRDPVAGGEQDDAAGVGGGLDGGVGGFGVHPANLPPAPAPPARRIRRPSGSPAARTR